MGKVVAVGESLAKPPVTLVHADFKLANMCFDDHVDDPPETVAFDWQLAARLRGPADLGPFIMQSFGVETRRSVERQLLNEYYEALVAHGVQYYSRDEFEWDTRLGVIPRFVMRTLAYATVGRRLLETPEGLARVSNGMNKLQILIDWNCEEVIPN